MSDTIKDTATIAIERSNKHVHFKDSNDGHALLSPSGSSRWLECTASVRKTEGMPNPSSKFAIEGTTAHNFHEDILLNRYKDDCDPDMLKHVRTSTDYVESLLRPGTKMYVEQHVSLKEYGIEGLEGGTADVMMINHNDDFDATIRSAEIVDLKYGRGVVEIEGNTQLMTYAVALILRFKLTDNVPVRMTITQPRPFHKDGPVRSHTMLTGDLIKWSEQVLQPRALECVSGSPVYRPSDVACKWCLSNGNCDSQASKYMGMIEPALLEMPPKPRGRPKKRREGELDAHKRDLILMNMDGIKKFIKAVEARAHESVIGGSKEFPMFKLVKKRHNRKFNDDAAATILAKYPELRDELFDTSSLKSPSKLSKILPEEAASMIQSLLVKHNDSEEFVVAPIKDPRKEVYK